MNNEQLSSIVLEECFKTVVKEYITLLDYFNNDFIDKNSKIIIIGRLFSFISNNISNIKLTVPLYKLLVYKIYQFLYKEKIETFKNCNKQLEDDCIKNITGVLTQLHNIVNPSRVSQADFENSSSSVLIMKLDKFIVMVNDDEKAAWFVQF